jgi:hypothetical protein
MQTNLTGDYHQDLSYIGEMMMKVMSERNDVMRMAICEAGQFPEFRKIAVENPRQLRLMLARYFEKQIQNKQIRDGHPELLAQAFLGLFFSYSVLSGFLGDSLQPEIESEEIVRQFVSIFIKGTESLEE